MSLGKINVVWWMGRIWERKVKRFLLSKVDTEQSFVMWSFTGTIALQGHPITQKLEICKISTFSKSRPFSYPMKTRDFISRFSKSRDFVFGTSPIFFWKFLEISKLEILQISRFLSHRMKKKLEILEILIFRKFSGF